jgi:hypothetical protein
MNTSEDFNDIRPFNPEELPQVYDRLLGNAQFQAVVKYLYPDVPFEAIAQKMRQCRTSQEFQLAFCYGFLEKLLSKASTGCDMDVSAIDVNGRYTFMSNHRDIVLDSALLDKLLVDAHFTTTCEIAIGDNLLSLPWVKDLVRVNKSFIVKRGLPMREMIAASRELSAYMHYAISQKHENIWIAQRQGRAKDSNDRTSEAVLKMMAMAGDGTPVERLSQLHIVPLAISYEYDPCDYLKAAELQQRRDNPHWKKGPTDDIVSMKTGIMGYKGRIHYHCAPCLDAFLASLPADLPKAEVFRHIAAHIDEEIFKGYRLYPNNYVAIDELNGNDDHADRYNADDKARFDHYVDTQLGKVTIDRPDVPFLRRTLLTMYANPAINQMATVNNK